jgi:hypothetical protein
MIVVLFEKEIFFKRFILVFRLLEERETRARNSGGQQWIVLETEGMIHME